MTPLLVAGGLAALLLAATARQEKNRVEDDELTEHVNKILANPKHTSAELEQLALDLEEEGAKGLAKRARREAGKRRAAEEAAAAQTPAPAMAVPQGTTQSANLPGPGQAYQPPPGKHANTPAVAVADLIQAWQQNGGNDAAVCALSPDLVAKVQQALGIEETGVYDLGTAMVAQSVNPKAPAACGALSISPEHFRQQITDYIGPYGWKAPQSI